MENSVSSSCRRQTRIESINTWKPKNDKPEIVLERKAIVSNFLGDLGSFKAAMLRRRRDANLPNGAEHWSILQRKKHYDDKINAVKEHHMGRINRFTDFTKLTGIEIRERLHFSMVWSNPPLNNGFKSLIMGYCDHLLSPQGTTIWSKYNQLEAFFIKYNNIDSPCQKICCYVFILGPHQAFNSKVLQYTFSTWWTWTSFGGIMLGL